MKLASILKEIEDDSYQGQHKAPNNDQWAAPLYDLTKLYPDDIYSMNAAQYYGHGEPELDRATIALLWSVKGKPNAQVKIYRAAPKVLTSREKLADVLKQKAYILKHGKIPPGVNTDRDRSEYYDWLDQQQQELSNHPELHSETRITINKGDWVTINKAYAHQHGRSTLHGKYRIISKVVPAKHIFTDANSIHEFGYDPS